MSQFALPLETTPSRGNDGYIVTDANANVDAQLLDWENWPNNVGILIGPAASGKTAMAEQFLRMSGGRCFEVSEREVGEELFHLWNLVQEDQKPLLIVSSLPVSAWNVELPDLRSRLAASLLIEIGPPDEAMLKGLFHKFFAARGLAISEDASSYLARRMDRNYLDVQILAQKMDNLATEQKKSITRRVAQDILFAFQNHRQSDDAQGIAGS
ncbi:DnaA/Hda family protein [Parasphingorhabdus sp.]|uniref:DnaA ATPase domain-containing protein n=1 Tax=Parasphingorhabdus sp. TaxID=2709688 RepID=UPI00326696A8